MMSFISLINWRRCGLYFSVILKDKILESKPTKINDNINNNFVLLFDIKYQIYLLTAVATPLFLHVRHKTERLDHLTKKSN